MTRYAYIKNAQRSPLETVQRYLPSNYTARQIGEGILIEGVDSHGWTMVDYVIPRLASGLHWAREIAEPEALILEAESEVAS